MKIITGIFLLVTLAGCGSHDSGQTLKESPNVQQPGLSNDEIAAIYAQNQKAIDLVWTGLLTEDATLRQGTEEWIRNGRPSANDVVVLIYSKNPEAIGLIWTGYLSSEATMIDAVEEWISLKKPSESDVVVLIYRKNETAIAAIWATLPAGSSMRDAVLAWIDSDR